MGELSFTTERLTDWLTECLYSTSVRQQMKLHNYVMMKYITIKWKLVREYNCLKLTILSSVCIFIELPNDEITGYAGWQGLDEITYNDGARMQLMRPLTNTMWDSGKEDAKIWSVQRGFISPGESRHSNQVTQVPTQVTTVMAASNSLHHCWARTVQSDSPGSAHI